MPFLDTAVIVLAEIALFVAFVNGASAPLRRVGTFGLAVGATCAFSLGIAGQVLTFHTGAWSSLAPPTRRMPLGQYQDIPELIPEEGSPPGFDIA